jgi:hypothetical protein
MLFPELARTVRENLREAQIKPAHWFDETLVRELLSILKDKARATETRLPRPTFPSAPVKPIIQQLPRLPKPNTREYQRSQADFTERISAAERELLTCPDVERKQRRRYIKKLQEKKERSLEHMALQAMPSDFVARWNAMKAENAAYNARMVRYEDAVQRRYAVESSILAAQASWDNQYGKDGGTPETRLRIVEHVHTEINAFFAGGALSTVKKLPWRFLPPGERGVSTIINEIRRLKAHYPHLKYDEERIRYVETLRPSETFVGEDEFDGYFAFVFSTTDHVLLENPEEGNAACIFKQDWMSLSKFSKHELLSGYAHCFDRILHRQGGNWKYRIRRSLGVDYGWVSSAKEV